MRRLVLLTVIALLGLAGSTFAGPATAAHSWIDAPLSSTLVIAAPVEVVAHATDPGGVTEVRLDVNGVTVADVAPEPMGGTFVIARLSWTPTADGLHRLDVYARNRAGDWGTPATTRVTVQLGAATTTSTTVAVSTTLATGPGSSGPATTVATGPAPPNPTVVPTTIPSSPTTTSPPTPTTPTTVAVTTVATTTTTVCTVGTPSPAGAARTNTLTPVLSWSYQGCRQPEQFQLQVSLDSGFGVVDQSGSAGGDARSWTAGPLRDCLTYYWRIRTSDAGSTGPWVSGGSFTIIASSCD